MKKSNTSPWSLKEEVLTCRAFDIEMRSKEYEQRFSNLYKEAVRFLEEDVTNLLKSILDSDPSYFSVTLKGSMDTWSIEIEKVNGKTLTLYDYHRGPLCDLLNDDVGGLLRPTCIGESLGVIKIVKGVY